MNFYNAHIEFLWISIIIIMTIILIFVFLKDKFQKILFSSIFVSLLIVEIIVYLDHWTSTKLFSALNSPEVIASLLVAIPTVSTWIMDSRTKKEFERISNLNTAREIIENLNEEKINLINKIENVMSDKQDTIDSLTVLEILNNLENFLLKLSEIAFIYRQLNTITFKMDIERLYDVAYRLFEMGLGTNLFPEKGDITSRFGDIFTKLIKNKLLYGIESKKSKDIYRDISFLLLDDKFEKLYYIDFYDIFENEQLVSKLLVTGDRDTEVFFENKKFIKCTISNSLVSMLKRNNVFQECDHSKLSDYKKEQFRKIRDNEPEELSNDEI